MSLIATRVPLGLGDLLWSDPFLQHVHGNLMNKSNRTSCRCKSRKQSQENKDKDEDFALRNNLFQDKQVASIEDSKDKLTITLDAHQFKPEEIYIRVKDGYVSVEAKHEERSEDGLSSMQFLRRYALPKNVKPEAVVSNLSSNGVLQITAPKEMENEAEIKVPITMKN